MSQSRPWDPPNVEAFGEVHTVTEWARDARCAVPFKTLWNRLFVLRWSAEHAISLPKQPGGAKKKEPDA